MSDAAAEISQAEGAARCGVDTVAIARIERLLADTPAAELGNFFSAQELLDAGDGPGRAASLAARFAAKEACSKALGTGISYGVFWRDMGVVNLPGGKPTMKLTGGALARLEALTPEGFEARIDLSITDDWPLAQAFVIISAVNPGKA